MTYPRTKHQPMYLLLALASVLFLSAVPAVAGVKVSFPVAGSSTFSPVKFLASATSSSPITTMRIYVDNTSVYATTFSAINTLVSMTPGTHNVVVQSWDAAGVISKTPLKITVKSSGVSIMHPAPNVTRESPVQVIAAAKSSRPVTFMRIYVDNNSVFSASASSLNTFVKMSPGAHHVVVQSWDSAGLVSKASLDLTVQAPPALKVGRDQYLALPYQAGTTHIDGRYAFTNTNFLLEGANRILNLGSKAIFVYLYPGFRTSYPDKTSNLWPATTPSSLKALAQTTPYRNVFSMPFKLYALTAFSFANNDRIASFLTDPNAAVKEEQEFYDLALYLLNTYKGTGKSFVLKHWEGDFAALGNFDASKDISSDMVQAMIVWLSARQRGVERARAAAGNPLGVGVFNAVEVNLVLDSRDGKTRVINAVVPSVKPDIVTYSAYDSTLGASATKVASDFKVALNTIKSLAPDPLNLGSRRILISEWGLFENEHPPAEAAWRSQVILQTAQSAGLSSAFMWQVFDNECRTSPTGPHFPVASNLGSTSRPTNSQCRGLWIVRPSGSTSLDLAVLSSYWY